MLRSFSSNISVDPWRPQTPHSDDAPDRKDTVLRPFKIIPGVFIECFAQRAGTDVFFFSQDAVHHYDEWGLLNLLEEPAEIRRIHAEMIGFVTSWLKDWNLAHGSSLE